MCAASRYGRQIWPVLSRLSLSPRGLVPRLSPRLSRRQKPEGVKLQAGHEAGRSEKQKVSRRVKSESQLQLPAGARGSISYI